MLTQLEQYANYEHSTKNLTRLVQLQRYKSGIQAIFGLILAKSVAGLKNFPRYSSVPLSKCRRSN